MPIGALAERIGVEQALVTQVFDHLRLAGRAETDGDRLLGVYGLTLKPTQHRLTLRGSTFFTWCAFDIVGIPAALGESAEIASECAHCHTVVSFAMTDGEPPPLPLVVTGFRSDATQFAISSALPSTSTATELTTRPL